MYLSRLIQGRGGEKRAARQLFEAVTAQSRLPEFYGADGVADTFEGRFEAITLHSALIMRRLRSCGSRGKSLYDRYCEIVFSSFDHAFREIGTGDLLVGKKMRRLGEAFIGRIKAYDSALEDEAALDDVLSRNLFEGRIGSNVSPMKAYMKGVDECLAKHTDDDLLRGQIDWPDLSGLFKS